MKTARHEKIKLNYRELGSKEQAMVELDATFARLKDISKLVAAASTDQMTWAHVFAMSAIVRAIGLHSAVRSAIESDNPHAAFPLLRTYLEIGIVICYVVDHPDYARVLASRPEKGQEVPKRVSSQAIVNAAAERYSGVKAVWDELSEASHLGSPAFWMPWVIENEQQHVTTIASWPRWRQPDDVLLASMQAIEFGSVVENELVRLVDSRLRRRPDPADVIARTTFTRGV